MLPNMIDYESARATFDWATARDELLKQFTLLQSVRKTHAAVLVDEGTRTGSLSAELSARIVEGAFYDLDAPLARVCSAEVPMPYPKHLEDAALPQAAAIADAARGVMRARGQYA